MTIPEEIKDIYRQQRDWQIGIIDKTNSRLDVPNFAKRSADTVQWAVAGWREAEFHYEHGKEYNKCLAGSGYDLNDCNEPEKHQWTPADWLAEAHAALMETGK